jgi:hypothetical protein
LISPCHFFAKDSIQMPDLTLYQREQSDSLKLAIAYLKGLTPNEQKGLDAIVGPYLAFRAELENFLKFNFSRFCTGSCYTTQTSACCSRDGVIIFWADVLINANGCDHQDLERLKGAIYHPFKSEKCIYLGPNGCLWRVRPLVCSMFVCDEALAEAFKHNPAAEGQWEGLNQQAKGFRWPDRPVLFDQLEKRSMAAGVDSALMYLHSSPGLLNVKRKAGLV